MKMIKSGDVIKHKNSMDVCFEVISIYEGSKEYKVKGFWINQGFVQSWIMFYRTTNIKIKKDNLKDLLYTTDTISCYRNANWSTYV